MKTCRIFSLFIALAIVLGLSGACLAEEQAVMPDISGYASDHGIVQNSMAFGGYTGRLRMEEMTRTTGRGARIGSDEDMAKVLAVMEKRVNNREVFEKVKNKLPALEVKRLKMLASLSDRMAASADEPQSNIAFLLVATLIIFS